MDWAGLVQNWLSVPVLDWINPVTRPVQPEPLVAPDPPVP